MPGTGVVEERPAGHEDLPVREQGRGLVFASGSSVAVASNRGVFIWPVTAQVPPRPHPRRQAPVADAAARLGTSAGHLGSRSTAPGPHGNGADPPRP